jgi:hypothetical protein
MPSCLLLLLALVAKASAATSLERTIDFGIIDTDAIIERLISPVGLVQQAALSAEQQFIGTLGWVALGQAGHSHGDRRAGLLAHT